MNTTLLRQRFMVLCFVDQHKLLILDCWVFAQDLEVAGVMDGGPGLHCRKPSLALPWPHSQGSIPGPHALAAHRHWGATLPPTFVIHFKSGRATNYYSSVLHSTQLTFYMKRLAKCLQVECAQLDLKGGKSCSHCALRRGSSPQSRGATGAKLDTDTASDFAPCRWCPIVVAGNPAFGQKFWCTEVFQSFQHYEMVNHQPSPHAGFRSPHTT